MPTNLWPDFEDANLPRSPKAVVEEAGAGLSKKTRELVRFSTEPARISGAEVGVSFALYVPSLLYHFPFMRITFPIGGMYPVKITADKWGEGTANNENELTMLLGKIFTAPSTVGTIQRLMALAKQ